jgi:hypothetical protein
LVAEGAQRIESATYAATQTDLWKSTDGGATWAAMNNGLRPARRSSAECSTDAKTAYVSVPDLSKLLVFDLETSQLVADPTMLAPENLMISRDGKTILSSWSGSHQVAA